MPRGEHAPLAPGGDPDRRAGDTFASDVMRIAEAMCAEGVPLSLVVGSPLLAPVYAVPLAMVIAARGAP